MSKLKPGDCAYVPHLDELGWVLGAFQGLGVAVILHSTSQQVWVDRLELKAAPYAPCTHCCRGPGDHVSDQCLFQSTRYAPAKPPGDYIEYGSEHRIPTFFASKEVE